MLWFSTLEKYNITDNWCKEDTSEIQKKPTKYYDYIFIHLLLSQKI